MNNPATRAIDLVLANEGGYVNNPHDPGGETNFGVTASVARANGYLGNMRDMPIEFARGVYYDQYWKRYGIDKLPWPVDFITLDACVNSGALGVVWLQRAVGTLEDGRIGPQTLAAVNAQPPLAVALKASAYRLRALTGFSAWGDFGKGWARRIANNLLCITESGG